MDPRVELEEDVVSNGVPPTASTPMDHIVFSVP